MKCPKCHFSQSDSLKECKKCGLIFEKWTQLSSTSSPVEIKEESKLRRPLHKGIVVGVCFFGLLLVGSYARSKRGGSNETTETSRKTLQHAQSDMKLRNDILSAACEENLLELGASEDEARANCKNDKGASKRIQKKYEDEEKLLHFVDKEKISRMEVRIKEQSSADRESTFQINLLFYDEEDRPASTEGKAEIEFSPDISSHGQRKYNIFRNTFRLSDGGVPYQPIGSFAISKDSSTLPADEIRVMVNFSDLVSGEASIRVDRSNEDTTTNSSGEIPEDEGDG